MVYRRENASSRSPGSLIKIVACFKKNFKFSCDSPNRELKLAVDVLRQNVGGVLNAF